MWLLPLISVSDGHTSLALRIAQSAAVSSYRVLLFDFLGFEARHFFHSLQPCRADRLNLIKMRRKLIAFSMSSCDIICRVKKFGLKIRHTKGIQALPSWCPLLNAARLSSLGASTVFPSVWEPSVRRLP